MAIVESNNTALDLEQFFPTDLHIQEIETTSDTVYIWMKSRTRSITCPKCNKVNITLRQGRLSGVARATLPDKQSHLVINYCIMF